MKWFENNLHHIHQSIDIAAKCIGKNTNVGFGDDDDDDGDDDSTP